MMWSFFGSGHGKGPHDGEGMMIKRFLWREQLNVHGEKLQNVEEVVDFLCKNLYERLETSYTNVRKLLQRVL
jgi:hypothetical protein